ncbi:MAG: LysE family translocator [Chloroflexota bacterium]
MPIENISTLGKILRQLASIDASATRQGKDAMIETTQLMIYTAAAFALVITPGPDMMFVIATSLGRGVWPGVFSAWGVCVGILIHTLLAALGLAVVLTASPAAFTAVRLIGGAYLVYLGIDALRHPLALDTPQADSTGVTSTTPRRAYFLRGMMSNAFNPKVALFFITFLPQFVRADGAAPALQMALLGIIYALIALVIKTGIALASGSVSGWLRRSPGAAAALGRLMGGVFLFLGVRLVI